MKQSEISPRFLPRGMLIYFRFYFHQRCIVGPLLSKLHKGIRMTLLIISQFRAEPIQC